MSFDAEMKLSILNFYITMDSNLVDSFVMSEKLFLEYNKHNEIPSSVYCGHDLSINSNAEDVELYCITIDGERVNYDYDVVRFYVESRLSEFEATIKMLRGLVNYRSKNGSSCASCKEVSSCVLLNRDHCFDNVCDIHKE